MDLSTSIGGDPGYRGLLERISESYTAGRVRAVQSVNVQLVQSYWQVGRHIVEFEQAGQVRAEYGKALIERLARDLGVRHGKGFSRSNLIRFRQFYLAYPDLAGKGATLSHQLTWSHLVELLKIDDPLERSFYEQQAMRERWSVRELVRQKESSLFLRLAASQDKEGILQLARQGQVVEQAADLLREPYVFEFLKIPEPYQVSEAQLESLLCDHLQPFLLELGVEGDNPPIGIILSRHKDELLVEYATYGMSSQLFVQKYQLYLPEREALRRELEVTLREAAK
jgi:predicted nuclease of restriction endonuclease-like (RecB) superfamily